MTWMSLLFMLPKWTELNELDQVDQNELKLIKLNRNATLKWFNMSYKLISQK